ncbi:hypothetical protein FHR81_002013 [Actinoalloteichus hoggarensis]|uniref:Uncharacterized protein n=1 Tax=Actinoalloteichus hoggarensis TaxID=1470176 RepID=A0A221W5S8_9PSEU|nr:hypothetical protein [Actinoalloteichus hoggarensis]ASO21044.1 hypothetical protein AHOG_17090 [Actinoalloteichus hoggarensis]MBB5920975.1 hypothetical protein [Actinoalloteichus hoggarensis]
MTFELRLAQPELDTFVEPVSPVLQRSYRTSRRHQLLILSALWAAFGALFVGVTLALLLGTDWFDLRLPGPMLPTAAYLFMPVVAICWHQISGGPARKVYGYAQASLTQTHNVSRSPGHSHPASRVASAAGWLVGWVVAVIGLWAAPASEAGPLGRAAAVLVAVLTAGVAVLILIDAARKLAIGRDWLRRAERRRAEVIGHGEHRVAVVTEVEPVDTWLDGLPVLRMTLEWTDSSGPRRESVRFTDYPCWAPARGGEFDVRVDPDAPDDPMRVFLRRRLVGRRSPPIRSRCALPPTATPEPVRCGPPGWAPTG